MKVLDRHSGWLAAKSTGKVALADLVVSILFGALVLPLQSAAARSASGGAGSPDTAFFYRPADLPETVAARVRDLGVRAAQALGFTRRMYEITLAEHPAYKIPVLDFRGTATGIDLLKVVETGIVPVVNTGIAHKQPGVGMVGAGLVKPPIECFRQALLAFVETTRSPRA